MTARLGSTGKKEAPGSRLKPAIPGPSVATGGGSPGCQPAQGEKRASVSKALTSIDRRYPPEFRGGWRTGWRLVRLVPIAAPAGVDP